MSARPNEIRIIGGRWRGRKLRVPSRPGVRPTPDRVRETLFNWLGQDLTGRTCLDLFAGSGALGFEALSRGATRVVAVERDPAVAEALRNSAAILQAAGYELHRADALRHLEREARLFDVIFLDPPFADGIPAALWTALQARLAPEGAIYVEAGQALDPPAPGLKVVRRDRAGQVHYHLLRRNMAGGDA